MANWKPTRSGIFPGKSPEFVNYHVGTHWQGFIVKSNDMTIPIWKPGRTGIFSPGKSL